MSYRVPKWPELSVKKMWEYAKQLPQWDRFVPSEYNGNHRTDRKFFWGIFLYLGQGLVEDLVASARSKRHASAQIRQSN